MQLVQTIVRFLVCRFDASLGSRSSAADQSGYVVVGRLTFVVTTVVGRAVAAVTDPAAATHVTAAPATDATAAAAAVVVVVFARGRAARRTPAGRQHHVQQVGSFLRRIGNRVRTSNLE